MRLIDVAIPAHLRIYLIADWCKRAICTFAEARTTDSLRPGGLGEFLARSARPARTVRFRHTLEGADDMPAHIRSALTAVQIAVPVMNGRMVLGTWQGIYVFEHRKLPHRREVVLHLLGE